MGMAGLRSGPLAGLLSLPTFRRVWLAGSLSSFGDWLALLATTSLAAELASRGVGQYLAVSGVFILRIAPAVVLGPLAGVVADRLDRRRTMVAGDVLRALLFVSVPLVGTLWWMYCAIVLIEAVSLFWNPAKDATVPNLVPADRLELANQLNLVGSYGTAPVAALVFSGLSVASEALRPLLPALDANGAFLAVYLNAATFLVSAGIVWRLRFPPAVRSEHLRSQSVARTIGDGLVLLRDRAEVRGLVGGMLGAFAAGGLVIGLAQRFVQDLGAGSPGYGLLFVAVFSGMATGLVTGPQLLRGFSRPRLFGAALTAAGANLLTLALVPHLYAVLPLAVLLGWFVGVAWVVGYTLIGLLVEDEVRGRTFALVQSLDGVALVLVLALAPLLAAGFDVALDLPRTVSLGTVDLTYTGPTLTFVVSGAGMLVAGLAAWRELNDLPGTSLREEARRVRRVRRDRHSPR